MVLMWLELPYVSALTYLGGYDVHYTLFHMVIHPLMEHSPLAHMVILI
jgi:hypothetical protein